MRIQSYLTRIMKQPGRNDIKDRTGGSQVRNEKDLLADHMHIADCLSGDGWGDRARREE